jgi:hypothetical protein
VKLLLNIQIKKSPFFDVFHGFYYIVAPVADWFYKCISILLLIDNRFVNIFGIFLRMETIIMKKNVFLKGLIALLFSINLSAMYNPVLYNGKPEPQDASWRQYDFILENWDLDIATINGGYLSLNIIEFNYEKFQRDEMAKAKKTSKYGVFPGELRSDIYSNPALEKLSCPLIRCPKFEIGDVVARINDNGELWHLDCLVNILRQNPSYENAKSLTIYFLFR